MAEGLARDMAPDITFSSAGSKPSTVHPLAIDALADIDIDISHHHTRGLEDIDLSNVDLVVTLCAEEVCPNYPGNQEVLRWELPDPAEAEGSMQDRLATFRRVRNELSQRLKKLLSY